MSEDSTKTENNSSNERPKTTINKRTDDYWSGTIETSNGSQDVIVYNLDNLINSNQ